MMVVSYYDYQKTNMKAYIKSIDEKATMIVTKDGRVVKLKV